MIKLAGSFKDFNKIISVLSDDQKQLVDKALVNLAENLAASALDVPPPLLAMVQHEGNLQDKFVALVASKYAPSKDGASPSSDETLYVQCPFCEEFHPI